MIQSGGHSSGGRGFRQRFLLSLEMLGLLGPGVHLLVAVSGGRDSVALLHLLKFVASSPRLAAAHLDHAMRPGSDADARWVSGLCRAWGVPLVVERETTVLRSEDDARRARYAFLRRAAREAGATHIVTAHHADDQAETVLFRILRGAGLAGLAGIAPSAPSGIVRPLLPFWRREIDDYARAAGLRWRSDPTNRSVRPARNRIRREILPHIERTIAPGARRNLVRLAAIAREAESAWEGLVSPFAHEAVQWEEDAAILARQQMREYDPAVGAAILRNVLRQFGIVLPWTGTRMALQFITEASSGREFQLPGNVRILAEWGDARIERIREIPPNQSFSLPTARPDSGNAEGAVRIGGRCFRVAWCLAPWPSAGPAGRWKTELLLSALRFPLVIRGWLPGDRIRTAGGTKTLKKLFAEHRVPRSQRTQRPVLAAAGGELLWVAGLQRAPAANPRAGEDALYLAISDD